MNMEEREGWGKEHAQVSGLGCDTGVEIRYREKIQEKISLIWDIFTSQ